MTPISMRTLPLLVGLSLLLNAPAALAYLPPEDAFDPTTYELLLTPQPNARHAQEAADAQYDASAAGQMEAASSAAAQQDALHNAAGDEPTPGAVILDDTPTTADERRDQRILERVKEHQDGEVLTADETLHSGAPLADTGLGTIVGIGVMVAAGAWTMKRAAA